MLVLGIETSCDETSAAVVADGVTVLSNAISSSRALFERLAGVIPEEAARQQVTCVIPVIEEALRAAAVQAPSIDAIAVTRGPGLLGSLLVGTTTARVLAETWGKPLIGLHHTLGHLSSTWLGVSDPAPKFPVLALSVSGGHSDLWYRTSHLHNRLIASTRDDAAGEAFDKGASLLGLPYPGGPSVANAAQGGDRSRYAFPLPLQSEATLAFSFSGLKTSLKYLIRDDPQALTHLADLAASYEHAICLQLIDRLSRALDTYTDAAEVHIVGGVSANQHLRELAAALCNTKGVVLRSPQTIAYCTDNAAMIAAAGYFTNMEDPKGSTVAFDTQATLTPAWITP